MGRKNIRGEMVSYVGLEGLASEHFVRPAWMLSDYPDPVWEVSVKAGSKKTINIDFDAIMPDGTLLTDVDHSHLLNTIRFIVFHVRMGSTGVPYSNNGEGQMKVAKSLMNMVRWMNLNGISRFSRVTNADFKQFRGDYLMGWVAALQYPSRFEKLVETYRAEDRPFPAKQTSKSNRSLDLKGLLSEAGMCVSAWRSDPVCAFIGQRLAYEEGLHIGKPVADFNDPDAKPCAPNTSTIDTLTKTFGHINALFTVSVAEENLDTFIVDPFEGTSIKQQTKLLGSENGGTRTIPSMLALTLMDRSIRWVVDYGPELLRLRDMAEEKWNLDTENIDDSSSVSSGIAQMIKEYEGENDGPGAPWPLVGFRKNIVRTHQRKFTPQQMAEVKELLKTETLESVAAQHDMGKGALSNAVKAYGDELSASDRRDRPSLHRAVNHYLPMACAIVILSQTARREGEVTSLRDDCISEDVQHICFAVVDEEGDSSESHVPSIDSLVEKTLQDWDTFPTSEIVVKAVALLKDWSKPAREITGRPELFQFKGLGEDKVYSFTTKDTIREFPAFVGADTDEMGEIWEYSDHQFRRFFALIYFWRYEGANLTALSQYLRHYDIQMTAEYIKEIIGGDEWDEVGRAKMYELFYGGLSGTIKLNGGYAGTINSEREKLLKQKRTELTAVTPDQFSRRATELSESGLELRIVGPGVACFGLSKSREHLALCKGSDGQPHSELASPKQCHGCANKMGWEAMEPNRRQTIANADEVIASDHSSEQLMAWALRNKKEAQEDLEALELEV